MNIGIEHAKFVEAGYDCVLLKPHTKLLLVTPWLRRLQVAQLEDVGNIDANLGLIAGNGKAFIVCDDKKDPSTSANVIKWLNSLGYPRGSYPIVRNTSGDELHIYINFTGLLSKDQRKLLPSMGTGDFYYGAWSYVTTFPSDISGLGSYELIDGDIAHLPRLDLNQISKIIEINRNMSSGMQGPVNSRKNVRPMSRLAKAICNGKKQEKYKSSSETEAVLVLSLIDTEHDLKGIENVFKSNLCMGYYSSKSKEEATRWLFMTYQEKLKALHKDSPIRRQIMEWRSRLSLIQWANNKDRYVFDAVLEIAYKVGSYEIDYSVRSASLDACVGLATASLSLRRLSLPVTGLLELVRPAKGRLSATYKLNKENIEKELSSLSVLRVCSIPSQLSKHDAFVCGGGANTKGRLGRRAGEVYELLSIKPLTLDEILLMVNACKKTISHALKKLRNVRNRETGEIIEMVTYENGKWRSNLVDLDGVASNLGTLGAYERKKFQYQKDRWAREREWRDKINPPCS